MSAKPDDVMPEHNLVHPRVTIGKYRQLGYTNNIFGHIFKTLFDGQRQRIVRSAADARQQLGGGLEVSRVLEPLVCQRRRKLRYFVESSGLVMQ